MYKYKAVHAENVLKEGTPDDFTTCGTPDAVNMQEYMFFVRENLDVSSNSFTFVKVNRL